MATTETKALDSIIASRRAMLLGGGAALAALAIAPSAKAANVVTTYTDNDILNFALNLEYLEANYYYLAAFGTNISTANTLYPTGAMVQGITGTVGTQGTVVVKPSPKVPFTNLAVASYAVETAVEEGKHVAFLRTALGTAAVAQPQIDLMGAWNTLATAAGIATPFDPFLNDATFLIGAYVFEDVGVTAYKGAASLISTGTAGKGILGAAAGILAVEAYHAGLVRTSINALDDGIVFPAFPAGSLAGLTQKISALRTALAQAANTALKTSDDFGIQTQMVSLAGASNTTATTIVDADPTTVVAFSRTTTQVLNIVTGGHGTDAGTAKGVFFPNGLNGMFS